MNRATKNIILNILSLLIIALFIVFAVVAKSKRNDFKPKEVIVHIDELEDNFLISKEDIYYVVTKNYSLDNQTIDANTLRKIENKLLKIPVIADAYAYVDNNQNLIIKVIQRKPIFRVFNERNETYYVDEYGIKFFPKSKTSINVPIVTGNIKEIKSSGDTIQTYILKEILALCNYTNQANSIWKNQFGQINVNEKNQIELIPRIGNSTVLVGNTKNIEDKMDKLKIFFTDVLDKVGWEKYRVINIMYKDQIICLK